MLRKTHLVWLHTLLVIITLALFTFGCSDDSTGPSHTVTYDLYVDVVTGSDSNTGAADAPLKTITAALAVVEAGQTIKVAPGTYNAAAGESFPLKPTGVELIGDEAGKGAGATPTLIEGGVTGSSTEAATMIPGSNTVIAGFSLRNPGPTVGHVNCVRLTTPAKHITLRNCTLANSAENPSYGGCSAVLVNGADSLLIESNRIIDNAEVGLNLNWGGIGSVIEGNEIRGNRYGVKYDASWSPYPDLGGGASGSEGGNIICCNTDNDLYWSSTEPFPGFTIPAANNFWDHMPPTTGYGGGLDIGLPNSISIDIEGGSVAPDNCP